jgi:two-component system, NarL family, nitrate/nitrite response regulator NarL
MAAVRPHPKIDLTPVVCASCQAPIDLRAAAEHAADQVGLEGKTRTVYLLILKGLQSKEIAHAMGNTEKTIKHYVSDIFRVFHVSSRVELFHEIFPL